MEPEIVLLGADNAGLLDRVAAEVFDHPVDPAHLRRFIDCPRHVLALALADGVVVGMASGVEYFHPDKPPQMWVNEVGVDTGWRNGGLGRRLTRAIIDEGRARGCVSAWVGTEADNAAAQACYRGIEGASGPDAVVIYEWARPEGRT